MSKSLVKQLVVISTLGIIIGAGSMQAYNKLANNSDKKKRHLASEKKVNLPIEMGKHLAVVNVQIQSDDVPNSENDELTLTGLITLNQPIDSDLYFKWALPEDVTVIAGQQEDSFANVKNGQTVKTKITLTGFSKESLKLVSLHGFVQKGDQQFGNTAIVTSRPEDSMEYIAPDMAQSAVEKDFEDGKKIHGKIVK